MLRFRRLRTKIVFSFCLLMLVGGIITTLLVRRTLTQRLAAEVERSGGALTGTVAVQLAEPIAYADWPQVRRALVRTQQSNADVVYVFATDADGRIVAHSFPEVSFPTDLLPLASARGPRRLATDRGPVMHVSAPIADGVLGTVHAGFATAWVEAAADEAVRNVLLITGLAMLVGVVGIVFLSGLITRPLLDLKRAVDRFGHGEDVAAPIVGGDEVAEVASAFNGMATQIRERVAESERLRAYVQRVLDHMPRGIVVVAENGAIEFANRRIEKTYGAVVGRRYADVFAGERPPLPDIAVTSDDAPEVNHRHFESASGRHVDLTHVVMPGPGGERSLIETSEDVTAQHELAERLQRAERLAVAGEISAGVVHTINNPLDGVRRAIELAASSGPDAARLGTMLELAHEGIDRIASVTRTLLGFARREPSSVKALASPSELIRAAANVVHLNAESAGIQIELTLDDDVPAVYVDAQAITEVLVNLLLNAVDACRDARSGGGRIEVITRPNGSRGIAISIRDDGTGIAPEILDRIFDPFFTTKEVGRGTGLGLSVARRVTDAHGGEILVRSSPGIGSEFVVVLPAAPRTVAA
jgi:signal transduction histidine kinase